MKSPFQKSLAIQLPPMPVPDGSNESPTRCSLCMGINGHTGRCPSLYGTDPGRPAVSPAGQLALTEYQVRGDEIWERSGDGWRELFAADAVQRLRHYEEKGATLERELAEVRRQRDTAVAALEAVEERFSDGDDTHEDWKFMGDTARAFFAKNFERNA